MKCCNEDMSNFSFYRRSHIRIPHFYCLKCGKHYYGKKWYTAEQWFFYINGVKYNVESHILRRSHLQGELNDQLQEKFTRADKVPTNG